MSQKKSQFLLNTFGWGAGLTLVPASTLGAYWVGGEAALLAGAALLPTVYGAALTLQKMKPTHPNRLTDMSHILKQREDLELMLNQSYDDYANGGRNSACFVVEIDSFDQLKSRYGLAAGHAIFESATNRVSNALRANDMVARISSSGLGICTQSIRRFEIESAFQIAERLLAVLQRPLKIDGKDIEFKVSIGLCVASRSPGQDGRSILAAATRAQEEATRKGGSTVHAYSEMMGGFLTRPDLIKDVADALKSGDITPWFQPQFDAKTGALLGIEALARWSHPDHGLIPPLQFLDVVRNCGLLHDMTDHILDQSLNALVKLDADSIFIPSVSINISEDDLAHPNFVDRVTWALDKHGLDPSRLCIEILETVAANTNDAGNIKVIEKLADMGCKIDLDDFGTGHASISSLRNFKLNRIKIDRSFVIKLDQDLEQQQMMETVMLMAQQLGFETLAEGVENDAELDILKTLGCGAVQGFGLAKPMPLNALTAWVKSKGKNLKKQVTKPQKHAA